MTPEESAKWVADHKAELREIDRLICPCGPEPRNPPRRQPRPQPGTLAVVYAAPDATRILWTAPMQHTGQDGTISKTSARATDLDKVPDGLAFRIELVQCPRCRTGAVLIITDGTIDLVFLDAPTRATVAG